MFMSVYQIIEFLAAVLPALALLVYVYKKDKVEKEPFGLLVRLLIRGVLAAFVAIVLEIIGETVVNMYIDAESYWYGIIFAFFVVAAVEEGAKYFLMKWLTWKNPNFNFRFDGIIYAVFVSLGFAAFENIGYVAGYGLSVAPMRAILSIPGHMAFAVYMGYYYGRAKWLANYGYAEESRSSRRTSLLSAIFYHGFYDACLMVGTGLSFAIFVVFVIVIYYRAFKTISTESKTDAPII